MKKSILVTAMAVVAAIGFNVSAQEMDCKKDCKKDNKNKKECTRFDKMKECKDMVDPFANLNLTDKQKEQMKALRENCQKQRFEKEKAKRDSAKAKREARMKEQRQERENFLKEIKSILTAEQYVQFLENEFLKSKQDMRKGKMKGMHQGKGKGQRHHKGEFRAECNKGSKECKKAAVK